MEWGFPELDVNLPVLNTPEQFNLRIPELACKECPERYCKGFDFYIQYWWYEGCVDLDSSTHFVSLDFTNFQYNNYDYAWTATQNWYSGTTINYQYQERIDNDGEKAGYGCAGFTTYVTYPSGELNENAYNKDFHDVVEEGPNRELVGIEVPWNMFDAEDPVNADTGEGWGQLDIAYATHWFDYAWKDSCDGKHSVFVTLYPVKPWEEVTLYRPDGTPYTEINTPLLEHHLQEYDQYHSCSPYTRGTISFDRSQIWFNGWPKDKTILGDRHPYWN